MVQGARKEEPRCALAVRSAAAELTVCAGACSSDVQLAAINALYNSLEFVRENFSREVRIHRRPDT